MSRDKNIIILRPRNLETLISFDKWIKSAVKKYDKNKRVPYSDLEKYLGYLINRTEDEIGSNKVEWISSINKLLERIESKRVGNGKNK